MRTFIEDTPDKGWRLRVHARNNKAVYILTSAHMHDLYGEYLGRYENIPSAAWYHRHAQFKTREI